MLRWARLTRPGAPPALLPQGAKMGPFPFRKMKKWFEGNHFEPDSMPIQHKGTGMWVPVWYLVVASGQAGEALSVRPAAALLRNACACCAHDV